jgi:glycosyltransferase involved in cell wall biosynthesis
MEPQPLVSIVTPCLNSGRFLERTLESVLSQDYPAIEYLVMDGGSTDGTLAILERYAGRLQYVSEPDRGVVDAINKGFARSRGSILAWLNADDTYLPGAIGKAVEAMASHPAAGAVYGEGYWVDVAGKVLGRYPTADCGPAALAQECCVCQPACFMRRGALQAVGMLRTELQVSFDYDLWIRLAQRFPMARVPEYLATSRMHAENKTLAQRQTMFRESMGLLARHYGYVPVRWVYGYLAYLRDGRDQFFQPLHHSVATYLRALPVGLRYNRSHPARYLREWLGALKPRNLRRVAGQK